MWLGLRWGIRGASLDQFTGMLGASDCEDLWTWIFGRCGLVEVGAEDGAEGALDGSEEGTGGEEGGDEDGEGGGGCYEGVVGGEPGDAYGYYVLGGAEGYVGDGLGAGGYGGADGGLGGVGGEGYGCSDGGGEDLHLGRELGAGVVGDESGDGDSDYGVDAVPDEVEGGDLVGDEFDCEEYSAGD